MDPDTLQKILLVVTAMVFSGTVHEWAHAFVAYKLGDDTAARHGRLTLNPTSHIDPIGTLLMPAFGAYVGFIFGYMKPVPFNPVRFTRRFSMKTGTLLVAAAGPFSNLVLAFVCAGLLKLMLVLGGPSLLADNDFAYMMWRLLSVGVWLNAVLAIFNLLPIYPLDGSKILEGILPRQYHKHLEFIQQNSLFFMIAIFAVGARFLSAPVGAIVGGLFKLFQLPGAG